MSQERNATLYIPETDFIENTKKPEKLLKGRIAVVTGGSRDIGAGLVKELAKEGVFVISTFRDKAKRADKVAQEVEENGGEVQFLQTDISTPVGRGELFKNSVLSFGNIDYLILNTSGNTEEVNRIASEDLVDKFLPYINDGGAVVRLQSVPGHFDPQLRGQGKMISLYDDVAKYKYEDTKALRKKENEYAKKNVKFIELTPPVVLDTSNMALFNRVALQESNKTRNAEEMHNEISDKLGLPRVVPIEEVGKKLIELLTNEKIKSGHTEFFNGVEDCQTALESWYGTNQVYINTYERISEKSGYGYALVSNEQTQRTEDKAMIDRVLVNSGGIRGYVEITAEHAAGHFNPESNLPQILPGHKQIRSAIECIERAEQILGNSPHVRLAGFESVTFQNIVQVDKKDSLVVLPTILMRTETSAVYDVVIQRFSDSVVTTEIKGLEIEYRLDSRERLLEDQMIEGAAQVLGVASLKDSMGEWMPLFQGMGRARFRKAVVAGDGLEYMTNIGESEKRGIQGNVNIYNGQNCVGKIENLKAVVVPKALIPRILK